MSFWYLQFSQKQTWKKNFCTTMVPQVDLFSFVFWENEDTKKDISKLTDLYKIVLQTSTCSPDPTTDLWDLFLKIGRRIRENSYSWFRNLLLDPVIKILYKMKIVWKHFAEFTIYHRWNSISFYQSRKFSIFSQFKVSKHFQ